VLALALVVAGLLVAALVAAMLAPVALRISVKGRGEWGKSWVVAAGIECWLLTVSVALAHEADSVVQLHLGGLRLARRSPIVRPAASGARVEPRRRTTLEDAKALRSRVERWFDLDALWQFVRDLRRRARLTKLEGRLKYATPDLAWTGMISGVLYMTAGLASPLGTLQVEPEWEESARAEADLDVAFKLWPGRALWDAVVFVVKNVKLRERPPVAAPPAQEPARTG
jgi:hypothetical protein